MQKCCPRFRSRLFPPLTPSVVPLAGFLPALFTHAGYIHERCTLGLLCGIKRRETEAGGSSKGPIPTQMKAGQEPKGHGPIHYASK